MRNTAKISESAVSVCSPPESKDRVVGFLPGGLARISRPASSGSSDSINCSSAFPPPNNVVKSSPNLSFTVPNASSKRWRPSLLSEPMPPRNLAMACTNSSFSDFILVSCSSTAWASSSARKFTAPRRSRSSRKLTSFFSISSAAGSFSGSTSAFAKISCGSHIKVSEMRAIQCSWRLDEFSKRAPKRA